jgi:tetratricopeptide (TPR) repeat protein
MKQVWTAIMFCILLLAVGCGAPEEGGDAVLHQSPYNTWTDSIGQFPQRSQYYYERGKLFSQNNDSVHALADLRQANAMAVVPDYALALSTFWLQHEQPDSARKVLLPIVQRFPENQLVQRNLLMSYFDQGDYKNALTVNDHALGYDSTSSGNWYNRARIKDALGDSTNAIHCLEKAYALDSDNATIAYDLANRYADAGNPAALSLSDHIIAAEPTNQKKPDPLTIKGIYYENTGDKVKALACFDEAIATDYTFLEAYLEKGILLYKQKNYPEALKVFELSTNIDNTFADGYFWIGRCQEKLRQTDEARLSYERAIAFDKHFTEAREALAKLSK